MYVNRQSYYCIRPFVIHIPRKFNCFNKKILLKRLSFTTFYPQNYVVRFKHDNQKGKNDKFDHVLNMDNIQYLEYMYQSWKKDPSSVSASWDRYFKLIDEKDKKSDAASHKSSPKSTSSSSTHVRSPPSSSQSGIFFQSFLLNF